MVFSILGEHMRINIGTLNSLHGLPFQAWIEPKEHGQDQSLNEISDTHYICLSGDIVARDMLGNTHHDPVNWKSPADDLRFERRIAQEFGFEATRSLINAAKAYTDKPFFAAFDHAKYGRLYAVTAPGTEGFFLETRPKQTALAQSIHIESSGELQAFLTSLHLEASPAWMPTREMLLGAIQQGYDDCEKLFIAFAELEPAQDPASDMEP